MTSNESSAAQDQEWICPKCGDTAWLDHCSVCGAPRPDTPSAAQTRDDLRTIGASLSRVEHSRRCEGWYACTCGVDKAHAALARLAKAVAS